MNYDHINNEQLKKLRKMAGRAIVTGDYGKFGSYATAEAVAISSQREIDARGKLPDSPLHFLEESKND